KGQSSTYHISADVVALNAGTKGILVKAEDLSNSKMIPFDADFIPNLNTNESHRVEFIYHPDTCGAKVLQLDAEPGRTLNKKSVTVALAKCPPPTPKRSLFPKF